MKNIVVGIDAITYYTPNLFLDIETLAKERKLEAAKLQKGLGLYKMAMLDVYEDTATMAANALLKLLTKFNINPTEIRKILMGTESALDGAKPTASFVAQMIEEKLESKYGKYCFKHCDVTETTFACIGGFDTLQIALDYVRLHPSEKVIVLTSDYAKYDLDSTGEYTQGAGALAMLVTANPRFLAFSDKVGTSFRSVFDFFKPRRQVSDKKIADKLNLPSSIFEIFKDEPVFDGQYSNTCYKDRITEAFYHFKSQNNERNLVEEWRYLIFHLPYAFHAKRMFYELFAAENKEEVSKIIPNWDGNLTNDVLKQIYKSEVYKRFVTQKIASSQKASSELGNLYAGAIFMGLLSTFSSALEDNEDLVGQKVGFFAYGSGSKAKVSEAIVQPQWKEVFEGMNLFEDLENRKEISFEQYLDLHNKTLKGNIEKPTKKFVLSHIEKENQNLMGARYYKFV